MAGSRPKYPVQTRSETCWESSLALSKTRRWEEGEVTKTLAAYIRRADEGTLSRLMVETAILLATSRTNAATVLSDAASTYKVDTDAIALKVKQEFAMKEKAKKATA